MKPHYVLQKEIILHNSVILRKLKLVIPHLLRHSILRLAHEEHISIVKCNLECHLCQIKLDHHQPVQIMPIPMPESPWSSVIVDLCGPFPTVETLIILVDYYSQFLFVKILKSKASVNIISKLVRRFTRNTNEWQWVTVYTNEIESCLKIV